MKKITLPPLKASTLRRGALSVVRLAFLTALGYVVLFQLCYMISLSLRPVPQNLDPSVVWLPRSITWQNFLDAMTALDYVPSVLNTLIVCIVSALIEIVTCALVAYGLACFEFPERKFLFFLVLVTIIVPPQMVMLSTYNNYMHLDFLGILGLFNKLTGIDIRPNVLNTPWTFYLPSLLGVGVRSGLFIFIYRQFFMKLPKELEEAAYVDGAGSVRTFVSVIVPSSGVAFLTVGLLSVIWHWNEHYNSSMYLVDMPTLAVKLSNIREVIGNIGVTESRNMRMAACLVCVLPVLILYCFLQKRFIKSIDRIGIVG